MKTNILRAGRLLGAQLPSLTGCLNFEFYYLPVQISADEFKSSCEPFPQVGASLPCALPSSPSLSFSLTFEILGFFLKLVESSAAMVWDGFALTLRGRLVGWVYLYISYQSVLASLPFQALFQPFLLQLLVLSKAL